MKIRKSRTKDKARKDLFSSESAASTVIAAVLLLSIVFTIFAVVRIAYVPEWKNDAEQLHMREVQADMTELKTMADTATFFRASNSNLPSGYSPLYSLSTTVRIRMGGGEVPIVSPSRSSGMLSVNKEPCVAYLEAVTENGNISRERVDCGGITYISNNEQYVDQTLRYENGGLILAQDDKAVMRQPPLFSINISKEDTENETYNYSVSILIISLTGTPESFSSETDATLRFTANNFTQINTGDELESIKSFSYTVFTHYPDAWHFYFDENAKDAGLYNDSDYIITETESGDPNNLSSVTFNYLPSEDKTIDNLYVNKSDINTGPGTSSVSTSRGNARQPPIPGFSFTPSSSGCAPADIQIVDESQYARNYTYEFGDGTPVVTEAAPNHTYTTPGTFTITQNVTNRHGTTTATKSITIRHVPIANFSSDVTQGEVPLAVNFIDTSQYATSGITWDFGDGSEINTTSNPTHEYTDPGTYTVTLTASNGFETNNTTCTIIAQQMPTAEFKASPLSGTAPLSVTFTDLSYNANEWNWNFGDGSVSTQWNPAHTYSQVGTYDATLTVTNEYGQDTKTRTITVKTPPPVAGFTASPTSGKNPLNVTFTDTSTNSPTSWLWSFGDGGTSTLQNPTHRFTSKRTYNVILEVSRDGYMDMANMTITVT